MAAQTCATAQHATLSTTVADSIAFTGKGNSTCVTNHDTTVLLYNWFANEANAAQAGVAPGAASWNVIAIKVTSAASMSVYTNGGTAVTFDPNDAVATDTTLHLGARTDGLQPADCDVGECIRYDSTFSDANLDLVGASLVGKWGTTWTAVT